MLRKQQNGIEWLEFELLADFPKLKHGIFLRHGGSSIGDCASLNCGYSVGDDPKAVGSNLKKIAEILDAPILFSSKQCHGKEILDISEKNVREIPSCDAVATRCPDISLMIKHADCQAAIFYDPVLHVAANAHSGWRGNVQNIYASTVCFMKEQYGSHPGNLHVGISPSLGPQDAQFINYRTELPMHFWDYQVQPHYFDFWEISKSQLMQCGVLENHIQIAGISTLSNPQDFFSFRYNKKTGQHATVVKLEL